MTYHNKQQLGQDPFIDPPAPIPSPIPPLTKLPDREQLPIAFFRPCKYCDGKVQLIIKRECIQDGPDGHKRQRYVPRDSQTNEIHNCRIKFNDTKKEHG